MAHAIKQWLDIGPCQVEYNGVVLGKTVANPDGGTHGGTRVQVTIERRSAMRDALGAQPYDTFVVGRTLRVQTSLTGLSLEQLAALIPGASLSTGPAKKQLKLGNPVGMSMRANAEELILKPIAEGAVSTKEEDWINIPLAFPVPDFDVAFNLEDQKVYNVEFETFDDLSTGVVATIGDDAAA